ncbi:condensation domain-containing protein, partial [Streptomyces sp. NPDC005180]
MSTDAGATSIARQQELLRRARAGSTRRTPAASGGSAAPPAPADSGPVPLSHAQRRMWLMDRLGSSGASYHVPFATRIRGPLDLAALGTALTSLVHRHEILRTRYVQRDGEPFQEVLPAPATIPVPVLDADEAAARDLLEKEAARPFDLSAGAVVRALAVRHGRQDHTVLLTFHHIAVDGGSLETVAAELAELYAAAIGETGRPPLTAAPQYADYARREHAEAGHLDGELSHLSGLLADATPPRLPRRTAPLPDGDSRPAAVHTVPLAPDLPGTLRALGAERGATL